ncbi:ATP-binding protein [Staphylococcus aureus]|uniref:ATP-binding protein n=1 Tax=Staphylococcus aureus TaxID=1280 RepID=UPI0028DE74D0|nr:ATP-binding protein [Staphylococcus aureus]HDL0550700.1 ATP-binding protein [Staphylococcus aureus]HDL0574960.1 ATP-binding protein [Staphylococcus aureus]HDL0661585.1 ATP-binding protein [Staphylococcus aureus]HDZ9991184.1 ATP-binding protein [Staphylococcus aureus]
MAKRLDFDIEAVVENIIFTKDGRMQAWFEFEGFHSNFDTENELLIKFRQLKRVFKEVKKEVHCLIIPERQDLDEIKNQHISYSRGRLIPVLEQHEDAIFDHLKNSNELGSSENKVRYYMGFELGKTTMINFTNEDVTWGEIYTETKEKLINLITKAITGKDVLLTTNKIKNAYNKMDNLSNTLNNLSFTFREIEPVEMAKLITWPNNLNVREPFLNDNWFERLTPIYNGDRLVAKVRDRGHVEDLSTVSYSNPSSRKHLVLHQNDALGKERDTYISFLQLAKVPVETHFPDTRWLEILRNLQFGVGVSLKLTYQSSDRRLMKLRSKKANLEDQVEHLADYGDSASSNVYDGIDIADDLIANIEKNREASFLMSAIFVVTAETQKTLNSKVDELKEIMSNHQYIVQNTRGLQLRSLLECMPGSRRYVKEFVKDCDINMITSSFFGNRHELGDPYGFYIGQIATNYGTPVFHMPGFASTGQAKNQSLAICHTGKTGGGKSFGANLLFYEYAIWGAKVLIVDPKQERMNKCEWHKKLDELGTQLNFITLSTKPKDAGKLDPFYIFTDVTDAVGVSEQILHNLLSISIRNEATIDQATMINRALEYVANRDEPQINQVTEELTSMSIGEKKDVVLTEDEKELCKRLVNRINAYTMHSLSTLIFGERIDDTEVLDINSQLNVLQVENLELADADVDPKDYSKANIVSDSILYALTAYQRQFINMFPNDLTVIGLDEAWKYFKNSQGRSAFQSLFREGRSKGASIHIMTQRLSDIPEDMQSQIGQLFAYLESNTDEINKLQQFFRFDDSTDLQAIMPELETGVCVYKDLNDRVGILDVRVLQEHLVDAFDTSNQLEKRDDKKQEVQA